MARGNESRRYESMIVLRADLQEAGTKEQIERVRKLLEGHGATIGGIHEWGLRELAYEIEKERRGYYVLVEYVGTAAAVVRARAQPQAVGCGPPVRLRPPGEGHAAGVRVAARGARRGCGRCSALRSKTKTTRDSAPRRKPGIPSRR